MVRHIFIFAIVATIGCRLVAPDVAHAQTQFPPALEAAFADAKTNMMANPAKTLARVEDAEAIAAQIADPRQRVLALATARWLAAEAHWRTNDAAGAAPLVAQGLKLIEAIQEPIKLRADLLQSRGALHMHRNEAPQALRDFQAAYRIYQQVSEPRSQAIVLQNIGSLYYGANDYGRAERYFRQAAETYDGDPPLSLSLHNRRGNVLLVLERYDEAEAEYELALDAAKKMGSPMLEARVLGNLARNQVEAGRFDDAEATLESGFALTRGADGVDFRQQLLATAARMAQGRGQMERARSLILQAFDGVDTTQTSLAFTEAHLYAYLIFEKAGDYARALRHLEALRRLKDEAAEVAISTNAALMAARFDYANQELRIANLQAEELRRNVAYEKARARWQRIIFYGLGGATLVVIALLTFGLITIRRSRNEVRAANADLESTNTALEKALAAKTEFLATTSHEIRTPLNGILGMTQVMLADSTLPDPTRDRIGVVHSAGVTMRALVDDILDVAKMETGNLTIDTAPLNLPAMLRDVTRLWEEQAQAKGVGFVLDCADAPDWVVSDPGRLRQIIFNLLSNALKFTSSGDIGLRASTEGPADARRLRLAISDSGIGIPADKLDEIFESFKQVDAGTTRQFGGTGLGLAICRNLARALGGDILVESELGAGSVFTIDLPLIEAEAPAGSAASPGSDRDAVLILDRNPIARSTLRTLLEARGAAVRFAATVAETEAALARGGLAVLLVDEATLRVGAPDPIKSLAMLAACATQKGVATITLWPAHDAETGERLAETGVAAVLAKPVKGDALTDMVFAHTKQNSAPDGSRPLVSRAA